MSEKTNGKVTLARLEERMISLQCDVNEIKNNICKIKNNTNKIDKFSSETRTLLLSHENNHRNIYDLNWKWVAFLLSFVGLISGIITFIVNMVIK